MRIAVIGKGNVGQALAPLLANAGHDVCYGVRDTDDPKYRGGDELPLRTVADAVKDGEVIILAVHWQSVDAVLEECGDLSAKILVDCINPLDFANNLAWMVPDGTSAGQIIAGRTHARVVKCFNQVGAAVMASAATRDRRPLQFVASDDADARETVLGLARDIGFDAKDAGGIAFSRELEGMARLWIAQAFAHGMAPDTAWELAGTVDAAA